jgi:hypothetical protein
MTKSIAVMSSPFLVIAMLMLPSSMASAEVTGACLADAKAKCPGVEAGGGKIRECIKANLKDLSPGCEQVVLKAVTAKACADDVKKQCAGVAPGEGRIEACMKTHFAELSDACKVGLANAAAGDD